MGSVALFNVVLIGGMSVNIGETVYMEIVKRAERGHRVTRVVLPKKLYAEWVDEGHNINSLFRAIGVSISSGTCTVPEFYEGTK